MVFNSRRDIIDIVYNDMRFLNEESCGKCTPCRDGTEVMMEILGRLVRGEGMEGDMEALEDLAQTMAVASLVRSRPGRGRACTGFTEIFP